MTSIFSRNFPSLVKEYDLIDFFQHENNLFSASLNDNGHLHVTNMSQLAEISASKMKTPDPIWHLMQLSSMAQP